MAASRRYYPGFLGALFLILLRTAIGYHFYHEGTAKLYASEEEGKDFSAEAYLRASAGPLAPRFRALVPDVDSLEKLDPAKLKRGWEAEVKRLADHYGFNKDQNDKAAAVLRRTEAKADDWFQDPETVGKIKVYRTDLDRVHRLEDHPPTISFEQERAEEARKKVETERRELVATVDAWTETLRESVIKLAEPEQVKQHGRNTLPFTQLDWVNQVTMYGLVAVGACLMLGFLTPGASLAAAAYLALFYLSMPPWPGVPPSPMSEGHYFIVNKNLIEMLACLVLASTPNGHWIGLDALCFGWLGRRRLRDADAIEAAAEAGRPTKTVKASRPL